MSKHFGQLQIGMMYLKDMHQLKQEKIKLFNVICTLKFSSKERKERIANKIIYFFSHKKYFLIYINYNKMSGFYEKFKEKSMKDPLVPIGMINILISIFLICL